MNVTEVRSSRNEIILKNTLDDDISALKKNANVTWKK